MNDERETQIIEFLKMHPEGLTIGEISAFLKIHRNTCARILDRLIVGNKIIRRKVGIAKLHYIKSDNVE